VRINFKFKMSSSSSNNNNIVVVVVVQPTFLAYFPFLQKKIRLWELLLCACTLCVCVSGWCWDMGEVYGHRNMFVGLHTCAWKVGYFMKPSVSQTLNVRVTGE
jgi:hypothetical protein